MHPSLWALFVAVAVCATAAAWLLQRSGTRLGLVPFARLSLWILAPALIVTALARFSEPESLAPGLLGLLLGHGLVWRNLRSGLD